MIAIYEYSKGDFSFTDPVILPNASKVLSIPYLDFCCFFRLHLILLQVVLAKCNISESNGLETHFGNCRYTVCSITGMPNADRTLASAFSFELYLQPIIISRADGARVPLLLSSLRESYVLLIYLIANICGPDSQRFLYSVFVSDSVRSSACFYFTVKSGRLVRLDNVKHVAEENI